MSRLFSSLRLRSVELKNRICMSPMCQYSCELKDGLATDWHEQHLVTRAVGGVGFLVVEATAVQPEGRISPQDLGIWSDAHVSGLKRITTQVKKYGSAIAIQLAHAGRKAGTQRPWENSGHPLPAADSWEPVGPSAIPFGSGYRTPREASKQDLADIQQAFVDGARRSLEAGFDAIEIHAAHGYLLHSFLSPISNQRSDEFGGSSLENRMRFPLQLIAAVRAVWPEHLPLFVRVSYTDWISEDSDNSSAPNWNLEETIQFAQRLKDIGVDVIDCSSGGIAPGIKIPVGPSYQVPGSEGVRSVASIPTAAVGLITEPSQAEEIIASGQADLVFLGRVLLKEPYWTYRAARELKAEQVPWPHQYERAY